ncbi:hypothetical protein AX16_004329 [Volvariella volvacea WC 439]|nr:hypothetical protein AX16_004329 [Volvariella volvacea WC 439]
MQFALRRSEERDHADYGWLKTFHTFSVDSHRDDDHIQWGPLRIINEDRIDAYTGFGTHLHREFEIFTYIVSGQIELKDSMNNVEILKRGDVQLTSAGTGTSHSEKCPGPSPAHFIQIWAYPSTPRLPPRYYTRHFSESDKFNSFVKVVAPLPSEGAAANHGAAGLGLDHWQGDHMVVDAREGRGPTPIHSNLTMYAAVLSPGIGSDGLFGFRLRGRKGYVHVIQTSGYNTGIARGAGIRLCDGAGFGGGAEATLYEGDGAYIMVGPGSNGEVLFENVTQGVAEVLLFDIE